VLVVPATAQLTAISHLNLLVTDRNDVPQRVLSTCCRRQGTVVALALTRGLDGTAELELAVEVEPRLRRGLIDRIAGLVDVLEVRDARGRPLTGG
jgi:acetolactate synthase regulatory subunit